MRATIACLAAALVFLLAPAMALAATVQDIVAMSQAGVSDTVILALIDRDQTIFSIDAGQIASLQSQGVSDDVILAMLRSGRQAPRTTPPAAQTAESMSGATPTEPPAAAAPIPAPVPVPGPEPGAPYGMPYSAPYPIPAPGQAYAVPHAVPYAVPVAPYVVTVPHGRIHRVDTVPLPPAALAAAGRDFVPSRGMFFSDAAGSRGMFFTNPR